MVEAARLELTAKLERAAMNSVFKDEGDEAALRLALEPFATVVIGEHRADEENVWHSLKVWHFRRARRAYRGGLK